MTLYKLVKWYARRMLPFYFSQYAVTGKDRVPGGPLIFVANHRNAFLDAVLVACSSRRNPWFITRADVFRNIHAGKWLRRLRMIPVYRFRDGFGAMKQNDEVIQSCVGKLNKGESILIFSEGNHGKKHQLRPLQKGVTRIAFNEALHQNPVIVPVGIYYESLTRFRSRVVVNFGEPIAVSGFASRENKEALLLEKIREKLEPLFLHIIEDRYNDTVEQLKRNRVVHRNITEQLESDRRLSKPDDSVTGYRTPVWRKILWWYSKINLLISSWIIRKLLLDRIADPQFRGSVKFAAGMFVVPVMLMIQALAVFFVSGSGFPALVYLFSVPLAVWLSEVVVFE